MNKKVYKIKNDNITTLFKSGNKDGELEFDCLIVNDNPDTIYRHYCFTNNNNKNCFEIGRYIYNKLENIADKELEEYVAQNINNTEFYREKDDYGYVFWLDLYAMTEEYPKPKRFNISLDLSSIVEGVASLYLDGSLCKFDFKEDKIIAMETRGFNIKTTTPLEMFYDQQQLNLILAIKQYELNKGHKTFKEMVNINKFFKDKKSMWLKFKDGKAIQYKNKRVLIDDIIKLIGNEFYINNSYYMNPRLEKPIRIDRLDYFQFHNKKYKPNIDSLCIE